MLLSLGVTIDPSGKRPRRSESMREESVQFLKTLVETGGTAGYEGPVQAVFRRQVEPLAESVPTDVMGNTTAVLNGHGRPKVMFAGHADEIGFLVRYVNDEGYLY